ncbi:hypothetical protein [Microvirga puerhi]|uniref:Outer membrane protein beta-barrel domain-containing protein n=1 Tax=Microvirga puerhi TaxID=2876078 RepID=A0ABS7VKT7_9HYPH|nr:hypothetical protein [Microvirga puerhi]MBZ6075745.1 hypothetical protein [Microvirga puerhi]
MGLTFRNLSHSLLMFLGGIVATGGAAQAADLAPTPVEAPAPAISGWTYRFTPYGWLVGLKGTETIRGRSVKVDASFIDIVEHSDSLVALMGDFEARKGPITLYGDVVWASIGAQGGNIRQRSFVSGATVVVDPSLSLNIDLAILEVGGAYEVLRSGPLAFDVLAGARYWYQKAELSLDVAAAADLGDLVIVGGRGFARSGSVNWLDPVVGARMRYAVAPGQEIFLRGDIGGFGAGSRFSWQAVGGYSFDIGTYQGITFSGVVGYRALYVDYSQGEGRRRYEFDMLTHGPIVGISARF